jgi:hypothetical protein
MNDNKFKNINLLFTTQYILFTYMYQVMSCHIHDCYSVDAIAPSCTFFKPNKINFLPSNWVLDRKPDRVTGYKVLIDLTSLLTTIVLEISVAICK